MIGQYIFRIRRYYREYGLFTTVGHLFKILQRNLFHNAFLLFYSDLKQLNSNPHQGMPVYSVKYVSCEREIEQGALAKLQEKRGKAIAQAQIKNRFSKGASLWMLRNGDEFVGFVWTICKKTVQPYFFPLMDKDVHMFDNEIFAEYRGKGINSLFINQVLEGLAKIGFDRVYIETRVWNTAEIRSLRKTSFRQYAMAKKYSLFGKLITVWPKIG